MRLRNIPRAESVLKECNEVIKNENNKNYIIKLHY